MKHRKKRILILVETSRVFGREIIQGISRFALESGNWSLFLEDRGLDQDSGFVTRRFDFDGIITRTTHSKDYEPIRKKKTPTVELLGDEGETKSEIRADAAAIGKMAADHFRSKGLRHFAFFSIGQNWWSAEFAGEYQKASSKMGFPCTVSPFSQRKNDVSLPVVLGERDVTKIVDWLVALPKPIGIFCPSDSHALLLINLCQFADISVPQAIAVLGVENNTALCNAASPPLSSIVANGQEVGYLAARLLDKKMKSEPLPKLPILVAPVQVATRQSSDLIAIIDPEISRAVQFIRDNAAARISVQDVAEHAGLSTRTLIRRFNEAIGHPPETEILKNRMERAKLLLRETDLTVSAIARNVGYLTSEYFIRAFRRECGVTPKKFRDAVSSE